MIAPSDPVITISGNRTLAEGGSTLLTCTATGYPLPTVLWVLYWEYIGYCILCVCRFDRIIVGSNNVVSNYTIFTNGSIRIYNAQANDDTMYCCGAVNAVSTVRNCTMISVSGKKWLILIYTHYILVPPRILRVPPTTLSNGPLPHGQLTATMDATFHIGQTANIIQGTTVLIECNATVCYMS